jgi:hypothetical protein
MDGSGFFVGGFPQAWLQELLPQLASGAKR